MIKIFKGDCLTVMDQLILDGVKVDAVITDPPFGTTRCQWDTIIPFKPMWDKLHKIIKPNGVIVLFGTEPFSSTLRLSNIKNYKYDWVWIKERGSGFQLANKQPLRKTENISVFYKGKPFYNSQGKKLKEPYKHVLPIVKSKIYRNNLKNNISDKGNRVYNNYTHEKKNNLLYFARDHNTKRLHPTQKPILLLEFLIKTYTIENETILDFTAGSFTTGVSCLNTNRNFIGIEQDEKYFSIGKKRLNNISGNSLFY